MTSGRHLAMGGAPPDARVYPGCESSGDGESHVENRSL